MQPKFSIGQKVKITTEPDSETGNILSYSFHPDSGFNYQISAKEVDMEKKEIVEGIKHAREEELMSMEEKHE